MHKVHPSTASTLVTFTEHEAAHLNLSSVPPVGAMMGHVGIRQESVNQTVHIIRHQNAFNLESQ